MLICIACRPVSCVSENTVMYFATLKQKANQTVTQKVPNQSASTSFCHEKFILILYRMIRVLYECYLAFMPRHIYDQI